MDELKKCPKCGESIGFYNIFLNAERTKGIHRCKSCGYEERHEPSAPAPPPLPYIPQPK